MAARVDLRYLACRFGPQRKIVLHSASLVRFHCRSHHPVAVVDRSFHSSCCLIHVIQRRFLL
jgi:hypothetical protein